MPRKRTRWDLSDTDALWHRFALHVEIDKKSGCWEWRAYRNRDGYGYMQVKILNESRWDNGIAHRVMYQLVHPDFDVERQLHHRCHNRGCVNPEHLEPVVPKEHQAHHPRPLLTHCKRGHEFTDENIVMVNGKRACKTCIANNQRARYAKNKGTFQRGDYKTQCKNGHPWIPENIYERARGHKECKVCHREREARRWREGRK